MTRLTPLVAITNESTVLTDAEVKNAMLAFANAVHYHFRPFWNETCTLAFYAPDAVPSYAWHMAILDDSDQAGALGYHDMTSAGLPLAKIFAKTDKLYGYSWTVTLTHELFEMLADPWISTAVQTSNTQFYALEVGDPVEADALGTLFRGGDGQKNILISDFITPNWFIPGTPGPYDYLNHCTAPLQVKSGGYVSIFTSGHGWSQSQMQEDGQLVPIVLDKNDPRFRDRG